MGHRCPRQIAASAASYGLACHRIRAIAFDLMTRFGRSVRFGMAIDVADTMDSPRVKERAARDAHGPPYWPPERCAQAICANAGFARRRMANPIAPKPSSISAQVAGSGTACAESENEVTFVPCAENEK